MMMHRRIGVPAARPGVRASLVIAVRLGQRLKFVLELPHNIVGLFARTGDG